MNKDNIDSDDEFKMNEFTKWKTQQEMNKLNRDKKKSKKKRKWQKLSYMWEFAIRKQIKNVTSFESRSR